MTPGIHSMPAEQYRKAHGVSNSSLKWIAPPRTPAHYRAAWITREVEVKETKAMVFGTLSHRSVFEAETLAGTYHVKPDGMSFATKEGKSWRAEHSDRPIISGDEERAIGGIHAALMAHPTARKIIEGAEFERSLFAEEKGLLLKARYDILPSKGNIIGDLKTIESADLESVEKAMFNFDYFRQSPFYLKIGKLLEIGRNHFVFIFVEKTPPYAVACYTLTDDVMRAGQMLIERDLFQLRQCLETDTWPGYSDKIEACALPPYAMKQIEALV